MTESELSAFVGQCAFARNIRSTAGEIPTRPPRVTAITVQAVGASQVVVWVVTGGPDAPCSYRFALERLVIGRAVTVSTESLAKVDRGGIVECTYWDMPGIVRDLGITAGARALGVNLRHGCG